MKTAFIKNNNNNEVHSKNAKKLGVDNEDENQENKAKK